MYTKTDKRRLYWLLDQYLSGNIDARTFCNEYYYCQALELDRNTLTKSEEKAFSELATVVGRFSEFEEDLKNYPKVYYTEEELRNKIIETKTVLTISTNNL